MSQPNSNPIFPPEVLDLCIDCIGHLPLESGDRKPTLLACHLLSRSLCHSTRRYLFSSIRINDEDPDFTIRLKSLVDLVTWRNQESDTEYFMQGIRWHIKKFTLHSSTYALGIDETEILLKDLFNNICGSDYGIHTLELVNGVETRWGDLGVFIREALYNLWRSPRLNSLRVELFQDLPLTFLHDSQIKDLHIYSCTFLDTVVRSSQSSSDNFPPLQRLKCDVNIPVLFFDQNPSESSLPHLQDLTLGLFVSQPLERASNIWACCSRTVRSLQLHYDYVNALLMLRQGEVFINASVARKLEILQLYVNGVDEDLILALIGLQGLLSRILLPPSLATLDLTIIILSDINKFQDDDDRGWALLDARLVDICSRVRVKKVVISMHFDKTVVPVIWNSHNIVFKNNVAHYIRQLLPDIEKMKSVELEVNVFFSQFTEHFMPRNIEDDLHI